MEYIHPRKNVLKLLMLIDSGGSMEPYQQLCSLLFQSVQKAGHFKDLKIYYFHNRLSSLVYQNPALTLDSAVETEELLKRYDPEYRLIFVGDAEMSVPELMNSGGRVKKSGMEWLIQFRNYYPHAIWLHPQERPSGGSYWTQSFELVAQQFEMYQMTLDGLKDGMKLLLVNR